MIWMQISANTGPVECCLGVGHVLRTMEMEAAGERITLELLDSVDGPIAGSYKSVLVQLAGASPESLAAFVRRWEGTVKWIWDSSLRGEAARKNWFIGIDVFHPPATVDESGIIFEATRSSGPGGQHVNKTASAIRATHAATGISVKVQAERSQHANRRLAAQLIASKLADAAARSDTAARGDMRMRHHMTVRGNPVRTFVGAGFIEKGS